MATDPASESRRNTVNQMLHILMTTRRTRMMVAAMVFAASLPAELSAQATWQTSGNAVYVPGGTNVGIGTASPEKPLHINSNTYPQARIQADSGETSTALDFIPTGASARRHRLLSGNNGRFFLWM